jgi:hypothetical protein
MSRRKRMHGRRRKRSPLHSDEKSWGERTFGILDKRNEDENSESPEVAANKNTISAQKEASEAVENIDSWGERTFGGNRRGTPEEAQNTTGTTSANDTTHSHPPAAIEEGGEEVSTREKARQRAKKAAGANLGGNWGSKVFGW